MYESISSGGLATPPVMLTNLPLDKMAAISQTIFRCIFVQEKCRFVIKI